MKLLFLMTLFLAACTCGEDPQKPAEVVEEAPAVPATPTAVPPVVGDGPMLAVAQGKEVGRIAGIESVFACDLNGDDVDEILVCQIRAGVTVYAQGEDKSWAPVDNAGMPQSCQLILCEGGSAVLAGGSGGSSPDADLVVRRLQLVGKELTATELYGESSGRTQATGLQWVEDSKGRRLMLSRFVESLEVSSRAIEGVENPKNSVPVAMAMRHLWVDLDGDGEAEEIVGRLYGDEPRSDGGLFVQKGKKKVDVETLRGVRAMAQWNGEQVLFGDGWHYKYREEGVAQLKELRWKGKAYETRLIATLPEQSSIFEMEVLDTDKGPRVLLMGDLSGFVGRKEEGKWLFEALGRINMGHQVGLIHDKDGYGVILVRDGILARLPIR